MHLLTTSQDALLVVQVAPNAAQNDPPVVLDALVDIPLSVVEDTPSVKAPIVVPSPITRSMKASLASS